MAIKNLAQSFPILKQSIHGHRLAYLDNAATTQKPQCVIDVLTRYYTHTNANIHRSVHYLGEQATEGYEKARETVQRFLNAKTSKECIFVKSTTEAINLVATCFSDFIKEGDEILISAMEHHSNIVPWQMLCERRGAYLKVIPMNASGELELDTLHTFVTPKTKLLAITHVSNALGTLNPIKEIISLAHAHQIPVFVDGAQSAPHLKIDVQALDCDFFTFSSHKTYGPTGVGVLYGKEKWLNALPPYQGGGDMISKVSFTKTLYKELPYKFEAGTPAISSVIGLGAALEYLMTLDFQAIVEHEQYLLTVATEQLLTIPGIRIIGTAKHKIGVISFTMDSIHPHDIGTIIDQKGVAIRSGHHCAMPTMDFFGVPSTARLSFGLYNTVEDIEQLMQALEMVSHMFRKAIR